MLVGIKQSPTHPRTIRREASRPTESVVKPNQFGSDKHRNGGYEMGTERNVEHSVRTLTGYSIIESRVVLLKMIFLC